MSPDFQRQMLHRKEDGEFWSVPLGWDRLCPHTLSHLCLGWGGWRGGCVLLMALSPPPQDVLPRFPGQLHPPGNL